ncbi:Rof/RNase P-like protein [Dichotomopilus funicola]|uniref:Ribonuclease P protein subunit n=1 Tax=Dichotomopilus funicola TaxID=1934379 RepID=A0AAN6V9P1_9PEZI|nr:Rof/RNase P-like protein [Dichotomopilus funicola]
MDTKRLPNNTNPTQTPINNPSKTPPIAAVLLARAYDTDEAARILTEKIQQRPLLLAPSSPPPSDTARAARRRAQEKKKQQRKKALKPKPLSAAQRRRLGLYDTRTSGGSHTGGKQAYAVFEPLHHLWLGYIREILGSEAYTGGEGAAAKLASADFHGAGVEVVRSGCVSRVGIGGIVVKDSKFAFEIVTRRGARRLVPKEGTVFRFVVPVPVLGTGLGGNGREDEGGEGGEEKMSNMVFEIHGEQFQFRSADRASRKFRAHFSKKL